MTPAKNGLWNDPSYWSEPAEQAFSKALRQGRWETLIDRLRGRRSTLLAFDDVAERPGIMPGSREILITVPLDEIVGSVGKDYLFTRSFLPKSSALRPRWKRAFAVVFGLRGYEPTDLYEVDGRFYVVDGHFRISVAKTLGFATIEARVRRWA